MATVFAETPDATQAKEFWTSTAGTVTYDTTQKKSGLASWKCDSGAGNATASLRKNDILADAGRRVTFYLRLANLPTSTTSLAVFLSPTFGVFSLGITSAGILLLRDEEEGPQIGGNGSTLSTGVWYRICISYVVTSTTVNEIRVFLDGTLDITVTNSTLTRVGTVILFLGWARSAPGASKVLNFHHVYLDDSTALTDTGDMRVTAKLPTSAVHGNFDTTGGSGAVNERPIDDVTDYKQHAADTQVHQDYDIETAAGGDVNISSDTIVALDFWIRAKRSTGAGGTPKIVYQADTEAAITLDTAYVLFNKIVDTATYPSAGASVVGMESTGSAQDSFLAECGVMVAYKVAAGGVTHEAAISLNVTGSITPLAMAQYAAAAALSITGSVAALGGLEHQAAISLSVTATLTAPAIAEYGATVVLPSSATVTPSAAAEYRVAAVLATTGILSPNAIVEYSVTSVLNVTATIAVLAGLEHAGAAILSSTGSLSAAAAVEYSAVVALSGSIVVAPAAVGEYAGISALSATAVVAFIAVVDYAVASALNATGTISSAAVIEYAAASAVSGAVTVSPSPAMEYGGFATLEIIAAMIGAVAVEYAGAAGLPMTAALSPNAVVDYQVAISLNGSAALSALAILELLAAASLSAEGSLAALGGLEYNAASALLGSAALSGAAMLEYAVRAALEGGSTFAGLATIEVTAAPPAPPVTATPFTPFWYQVWPRLRIAQPRPVIAHAFIEVRAIVYIPPLIAAPKAIHGQALAGARARLLLLAFPQRQTLALIAKAHASIEDGIAWLEKELQAVQDENDWLLIEVLTSKKG